MAVPFKRPRTMIQIKWCHVLGRKYVHTMYLITTVYGHFIWRLYHWLLPPAETGDRGGLGLKIYRWDVRDVSPPPSPGRIPVPSDGLTEHFRHLSETTHDGLHTGQGPQCQSAALLLSTSTGYSSLPNILPSIFYATLSLKCAGRGGFLLGYSVSGYTLPQSV